MPPRRHLVGENRIRAGHPELDRPAHHRSVRPGRGRHMTVADDSVKFICDVRNVEDLLLLPNTNWVIGSGFNLDPASQNYLHLFNAENETGVALQASRFAARQTPRPSPTGPPPVGRP